MSERPFFSLVIPCYNDGRYAPGMYIDRLLTSLTEQNINKDDLEIIISDDHSPLPYDLTLDRYRDRLNIKTIKTDYNFAPGNTRQKGTEIVTGEWLCFADHDDLFYPNSLGIVKSVIEEVKEQYIVACDFDKVLSDDLDTIVEEFRFSKKNLVNWVHGKFYNVDNFWKPYHLHFLKDLKTHEDIALGKLVTAALVEMDKQPTFIQKPVYMWTFNPESVSHGNYKETVIGNVKYGFLETHFDDFLRSSVDVFIESYQDEVISKDSATIHTMNGLMTSYMNICLFKNQHKKKYLKTSDAYASKQWAHMKESLDLSLTVAKVLVGGRLSKSCQAVDSFADQYNQPHVVDWLKAIDEMDYLAVIDKEKAKMVRNIAHSSKLAENSKHRPFYSIVIACYNDGRYEEGVYLDRLLSSIARQNMPKEDLEVVLSDDCSPVPFDSIVAKHEGGMTIKYIKTDYNFAPGNTRAKGVTIATGEWLCFADHDDIFYDGALKTMHDTICAKDEKYFALGDFDGVSPEGQVLHKYECHLNWCHGKFYNKDNLWDKFNIHFIKDLKSHEDIAICTQVGCLLATAIPNYTYLHKPVYAWTDNPQSVSHAKYTVDTESGPREFLEVFFEDYLTATGYIYLEQFSTHAIKIEYAVKSVLEIMCYAYFYTQGFQFRRPDDFYSKNLEIAGKFITTCKETFHMTNQSMYNAIASGDAVMYYRIRKLADPGSGRYIPTQTLKEWFELVSPDKEDK